MSDGKKPRVWQAFTQPAGMDDVLLRLRLRLAVPAGGRHPRVLAPDNDIDLVDHPDRERGPVLHAEIPWAPLVDR